MKQPPNFNLGGPTGGSKLNLGVLVGGVVGGVWVGVASGASGWRWGAVLDLVRGDDVVAMLRAPRVALAALTGAALALSGLTMQTLLRNDLADPYILGLAGGASVGAVVSLAIAPSAPPGPAAALGAWGAAVLLRLCAGAASLNTNAPTGATAPTTLLLAGVAVGSLLSSATGLVLVLAPAERLLRSATFWLFGGLGTPAPQALILPAALLLVVLFLLHRRAESLDRLLLGDDVASSLGVDVPRFRRTLLILAVALTSVAVAAAGLIGFVGLLAPHAARRLFGPRHRPLLLAAPLLGATLLLAADTLARTAFAPREVPVGLVTAALGGPLFLALLRRRARWTSS
ncbi:MAG TPA: iron ABC transporter permease [Polyangia bacterium]